jgi:hypothetical protein
MFRSSTVRWLAGFIAVIAVISIVRLKPWQKRGGEGAGDNKGPKEVLQVGFLPVT